MAVRIIITNTYNFQTILHTNILSHKTAANKIDVVGKHVKDDKKKSNELCVASTEVTGKRYNLRYRQPTTLQKAKDVGPKCMLVYTLCTDSVQLN